MSASIDGDVVEVLRGRYYESIDLGGKAITLTGSDPNDWWIVESTIIDANAAGTAVVDFNDVDGANSVLTGLMLTNGEYGIACSNSSPTISRCIVEDNNSHGIYCPSGSPLIANNIICLNGDDGIYSSSSSPPTIKNNWLYDNDNGIGFSSATSAATVRNNTVVYNDSNGIYVNSGTAPTITNCILWDNGDDLDNCSATYSCIKDLDSGTGNLVGEANDPCFLDDPDVDCRLQHISPCKNAGTGTFPGETDIEGHVRDANGVDMGADEICEVHNVTQDVWYESIQHAIDDANNHDVIEAYEWTFYSTDPCNWDVVAVTIINANDTDANAVTFDSGQDSNSVLRGFTVTGGKNGVYCDNSSSPIVKNCLIEDNNSTGILCVSGSPLLTNNKIVENSGDGICSSSANPPTIKNSLICENEGGISLSSATAAALIRNNTIVDNNDYGIYVGSGTAPDVNNCILWAHDSNDLVGCSATYSCIEDSNDANGIGNITDDPLFVNPDSNNYNFCLWPSSPCVDAGDPNGNYAGEYDVFGNDRVNDEIVEMGAIEDPYLFVDDDSTWPFGVAGIGTNWEKAYKYLRDALDAASDSYIIYVAQGVYKTDERASGASNDRNATFTLKNNVIIMGGYAALSDEPRYIHMRNVETCKTILSGDIDETGDNDSYHVVTVESYTENATLSGVTITGGNANGSSWPDNYGGGVFNTQSNPLVTDCVLTGNKAKRGGGMKNSGTYETRAYPILTNCTFSNNEATAWHGGGMANYKSSPRLNNCTFSDNSAVLFGGGMDNFSSSHPRLTNCVFSGNSAGNSAGGMRNNGNCSPKLTNCVFSDNSADGSCGAVQNVWQCFPTFVNCVFCGNESAITAAVMCSSASGGATLTNCTLYGNTCTGDGEVIRNYTGSGSTITNCIFWNAGIDEIQDYTGSITVVNNSCVEGGWTGSGGNNITDDPKFVAAADPNGPDDIFGTPDDGLAIDCDTSPCIDKGDDTALPPDVDDLDEDGNFSENIPFDIVENKRETGSGADPQVDMGAYEAMQPEGHWKLDGDCDDSRGSNNLSEPTSPDYKTGGGVLGDALQFDGSDDCAKKDTASGLDTDADFTWTAWIRTLETESGKKVLTNGGVIMAKCPALAGTNYDDGDKCLYVVDGGANDGKLAFDVSKVALVSNDRVDDGMWHHVAVTVEFGSPYDTAILYIDGEPNGTKSDWNVNADPESAAFKVGFANNNFPSGAKYFDGRIDDVRFYDYVLDDKQIESLFRETGYWRFVATGDSRDDDDVGRRDPDDREPGSYDGVNNNRLAEIANAIIAERAELVLVT
ncbi:MAG: right-handed parallel beta-helix repeat-containing protein, partial [Planctomycetota bacterium]